MPKLPNVPNVPILRWLSWRYFIPSLIGIVVVGIAASAGGLWFVSEQEKNNQFCGSCHTEPEVTYLARFDEAVTNGNATDLAAFHHKHKYPRNSANAENIRCIDCHVGEGLVGRTIVVSLAAYDALKWVTGTAQQPAQVIFNIQDEGCIKCHEAGAKKFLDQPEKPFIIDNHFHYKLFVPGAPDQQCVDCHPSHRPGSELNQFQFRRVTVPVCEECHRLVGHGPVKMQ